MLEQGKSEEVVLDREASSEGDRFKESNSVSSILVVGVGVGVVVAAWAGAAAEAELVESRRKN